MYKDMIVKRLSILDDLSSEINVLKEQYDDLLENDPDYQELKAELDEVKEATRNKSTQVMEKTSIKDLKERMKEKRMEISDNKEALAIELVEYYKETGSLEIEDIDGNIKKLKFSVKLTS